MAATATSKSVLTIWAPLRSATSRRVTSWLRASTRSASARVRTQECVTDRAAGVEGDEHLAAGLGQRGPAPSGHGRPQGLRLAPHAVRRDQLTAERRTDDGGELVEAGRVE